MIALARAAASGIGAALRAPLWIRGHRWAELLHPPAGSSARRSPPEASLRAALLTLRALSRLPAGPWRNTCLYRSVAHCLLLRRHGMPAVVRIGVRVDEGSGEVLAHAWVVPDPAREGPPPDSMHPFPVTDPASLLRSLTG